MHGPARVAIAALVCAAALLPTPTHAAVADDVVTQENGLTSQINTYLSVPGQTGLWSYPSSLGTPASTTNVVICIAKVTGTGVYCNGGAFGDGVTLSSVDASLTNAARITAVRRLDTATAAPDTSIAESSQKITLGNSVFAMVTKDIPSPLVPVTSGYTASATLRVADSDDGCVRRNQGFLPNSTIAAQATYSALTVTSRGTNTLTCNFQPSVPYHWVALQKITNAPATTPSPNNSSDDDEFSDGEVVALILGPLAGVAICCLLLAGAMHVLQSKSEKTAPPQPQYPSVVQSPVYQPTYA